MCEPVALHGIGGSITGARVDAAEDHRSSGQAPADVVPFGRVGQLCGSAHAASEMRWRREGCLNNNLYWREQQLMENFPK